MGPNEVTPVPPITVPLVVVRSHHSLGDVVVCRVEKTFPHVLLGGVHMFHDTPCVSSKMDEKCVRKVRSDGKAVKEWEAMSAIVLSSPGIWQAANKEDSQASIQMARA